MIKIEKTETYGWEAAIRGMRNPMNSWEKSDSVDCRRTDCSICGLPAGRDCTEAVNKYVIGDADFALMKKLAAAGTDHAKYLRMITVTADIVAPLYWYKEFDTYKVGTVANSCSTMHKIHAKEFTLDDFSHEHLSNFSSHPDKAKDPVTILQETVKTLNSCRECYIKEKDKFFWWQMIQLLPSSYNQRRTVMLNYAVLRNIYHARKSHKLDEWRDFCTWAEQLPYSELITA